MRTPFRRVALEILIWPFALLFAYPIFYMVNTSFKTSAEIADNPLALPHSLSFHNYANAFVQAHLASSFANSLIITSISVILLIFLGSMAAFPLSQSQSLWSKLVYVIFLAGTMVSVQQGLIQLTLILKAFHLVNTYFGVSLVEAAFSMPLAVFLYVGFLRTVSREIIDAASIDGCSDFRAYWSVVFPLLRPVTATVIIVTSLGIWNDFLIPLLYLRSQSLHTLMVSIIAFVGDNNKDWSVIFPSLVLAMTPIILLYLFMQTYVIKGVAAGSIKE